MQSMMIEISMNCDAAAEVMRSLGTAIRLFTTHRKVVYCCTRRFEADSPGKDSLGPNLRNGPETLHMQFYGN